MHHELFRLLHDEVQPVLHITREQLGGGGCEGVEGERLGDILWVSFGGLDQECERVGKPDSPGPCRSGRSPSWMVRAC